MTREETNSTPSVNPPAKQRLYYIDALKGFATILVVLGHVFNGYIKAGLFIGHRDLMCGGYNLIYSFHMALFFLISGFVFNKAYIGEDGRMKSSFKTQLANIAVIYVVFSVLFGLFKMLMGAFANGDVSLRDIFLIGVFPIAPYWYLYVLFFLYLVFSIESVNRLKPAVLLPVLVLVAVASNFIPDAAGDYFEVRHFLYYMLFFGTGIALSRYQSDYAGYEPWLAFSAFAVALLVMIGDRVGFTYEDYSIRLIYLNRKWNLVIAMGISLMLLYVFRIAFSDGSHIHVRAMSFLGRYALEIYVIHCVFTAGNRVVLQKLHITNFYVNVLCNCVISVALPVLFAVACKKMHMHKLIFRPVSYFSDRKKQLKG